MNLNVFDDNGSLVPIEFESLPFEPKRIFYITGTPKYGVRGCHAHLECEQILICLQGTILVNLYDGQNWETRLLRKNENLYIDKMIWDEQVYVTGDDILLSICSIPYDEKDYISDMEQFERMKSRLNG